MDLKQIMLQEINNDNPAEYYKKCNKILNKINKEDAKALVQDLDSENVFQQILKLKLIQKFKLVDEVIVILKGKNQKLIEKVLTYDFLFKENSPLKAWNFFNDLLPLISFTTRCKLLSNLSKYENHEICEEYFEKILLKYNLSTASIVLPGCTTDFIKRIVVKFGLVLHEAQLSKLGKGRPDFVYWYLNEFKNKIRLNDYKNTYTFMIRKENAGLFLDFFEENKKELSEISVGRRVSKQCLKKSKSSVVENSKLYRNFLKYQILIQKLTKEDMEKFLLNFYSNSPEELSASYCADSILKSLSKEYRLYYILTLYKGLHKIDLLQDETLVNLKELLDNDLIEILPEHQRILYARHVLKDDPTNVSYIKFLPIEETERVIEKNLKISSLADQRESLIDCLIRSCIINKKHLKKNVLWVLDRFRNDENWLLNSVFQILNDNIDSIVSEMKDDDVWEAISLRIQKLLTKSELYDRYYLTIILRIIQERVKNNLPIDDQVNILIKINECCSWIRIPITEPSRFSDINAIIFSKYLEFTYNEYLIEPKTLEEDDDMITFLIENVLNCSKKFDWKWLMNLWINHLKTNTLLRRDIFNFCMKIWKETKNDEILEIIDNSVFKEFRVVDEELFIYYIKHKPTLVKSKIELFLENYFKAYSSRRIKAIFKLLKGHLQFQDTKDKIIEVLTKTFEDSKNNKLWPLAVKSLCSFTSGVNILRKYFPTQVKEDDMTLHQLRNGIAMNIHNLDPRVDLKELKPFIQSDYLVSFINSFYSLCFHTPENESIAFLQSVSTTQVSLCKHLIRLQYMIGTKVNFEEISSDLNDFKHPSLRAVVCNIYLKEIITEFSAESFQNLTVVMKNLTENDQDAWNLLFEKMDLIPAKFKIQYLDQLWNIFQTVQFENLNYKRNQIVTYLNFISTNYIQEISTEFVQKNLSENLFETTCHEQLQEAYTTLAIGYLFSFRTESKSFIFEIFNEKLLKQISNSWAEKFMKKFIEHICNQVTIEKYYQNAESKEILALFLNQLEHVSITSNVFVFSELLNLRIAIIKFDYLSNRNWNVTVQDVCTFFEKLAESYGTEIIPIVAFDSIKELVSSISRTLNIDQITLVLDFVETSLNFSNSVAIQLIAALYLRLNSTSAAELDRFKSLVGKLKKSSFKSVTVLINLI